MADSWKMILLVIIGRFIFLVSATDIWPVPNFGTRCEGLGYAYSSTPIVM